MFSEEKIIPKLVDYDLKLILHKSLQQSHSFKQELYNNIFNITLFTVFFISLSLFLYFRYKGKLKPEEIYQKQNEKRLYVLSKLQQLNNIQMNENNKLITNLPHFYL